MTTLMQFIPGNGHTYHCEVRYIARGGATGPDGACAFCKGDPCAEDGNPYSKIAHYFKHSMCAETCPFCGGAPS